MTTRSNSDAAYQELLAADGRNAIVARATVEAFLTGETKLRRVQEMAVEYSAEYGLILPEGKNSIISRTGRWLRDAGVFLQFEKRTTKGYTLEPGGRLKEFSEFLEENPDYGTRLTGDISEELGRGALIDHLKEYGSVRANATSNKIPPKIYKLLAERMAAGELDVIYVPRGAVVATKHKGQKVMVDYYVG